MKVHRTSRQLLKAVMQDTRHRLMLLMPLRNQTVVNSRLHSKCAFWWSQQNTGWGQLPL